MKEAPNHKKSSSSRCSDAPRNSSPVTRIRYATNSKAHEMAGRAAFAQSRVCTHRRLSRSFLALPDDLTRIAPKPSRMREKQEDWEPGDITGTLACGFSALGFLNLLAKSLCYERHNPRRRKRHTSLSIDFGNVQTTDAGLR